MATFHKKGKYLTAEVRFRYNPKNGNVELSSTDPDISKNGFHLTLDPSSLPAQEIMSLLQENGVQVKSPDDTLPEVATIPTKRSTQPHLVPLGTGESGEVAWDMSASPHFLVAGRTGAGKSTLFRGMLKHFLAYGETFEVSLIDGRNGLDFHDLLKSDCDGNTRTAFSLVDAVQELARLVATMDEVRGSDTESQPVRVVLIDSVLPFLAEANPAYPDEVEQVGEFRGHLLRILREGRASGIHVVMGAQYTSSRQLGMHILNQMTSVCAVGRLSTVESTLLFGNDIATKIPNVKGRAIFSSLQTAQPVSFQAYFTRYADS